MGDVRVSVRQVGLGFQERDNNPFHSVVKIMGKPDLVDCWFCIDEALLISMLDSQA